MGKVQDLGEEEQREHIEATETPGRAGVEAIEAERRRNALEMEKRVARIAEWMQSGKYPMAPRNPLYDATDDEVRAYIRKRREEFMAKGGKWDQYQAEKARKEAERVAVKK